MPKIFIVKVAPLIRLPASKTQVFSYWSPEEVSVGSLVEIQFGFRMVRGIVVESNKAAGVVPKYLKKIQKVLEDYFLDEKQIIFAKHLAGYYIAALGLILKMMVPVRSKTRTEPPEKKVKRLAIPENREAREILRGRRQKYILIGPRAVRQKTNINLAKFAADQKRQYLYLASEILSASLAYEKMIKYFSGNIVLVHSGLSRGQFWDRWREIKDGRVKIIIATKVGVFLPFQNLEAIFIDEPLDISHKQWETNPRFAAPKAAEFLSLVHGARLIFSGAALPLTIQLGSRQKEAGLIKIANRDKIDLKVVNFFDERNNPNFPISDEFFESISQTLTRKKKTAILVNRRGYSNYTFCQKCQSVLRCPKCERALVYFEDSEKYCCLHCSFKADILSVCSNCGAGQFSHFGVGVDQVEKKLKRLFPGARILKVTRDLFRGARQIESIISRITAGQFDILLGTQLILKVAEIRKFDLAALPDFDHLEGVSDFGARESAYASSAQAMDLVGEKGQILVGTMRSQKESIEELFGSKAEKIYEKELRIRKKMNLPPFVKLIKIIYRNKNRKKCVSVAQKMFDLLNRLGNNEVEISEPYEPLAGKKRSYFYRNILLKIDAKKNIANLSIYSTLANLGKGWAIDVDPINTI